MNLALADRRNFADKTSASLIASQKVSMLVAIAPDVESPEVLIAGVLPGAEILLLNDCEDSITQISRALAANPAQTLSIVCHGSSGKLDLGNMVLDRHSLPKYQSQLQAWGISELVLYACEVGQDRNFIAQLSEQTGARVVAATGKVGNAALGGNWQLEDSNGEAIETLAFHQQARQEYAGVLMSFSPQTTFAAGTSPNSVAVGDFNGDSKPDLAVTNFTPNNNVSVLLGNGSGSFSTQPALTAGNRPYSVAVGDFNGDGKPDLAVANSNSNNVSVLLGNGSGGFGTQTTFAAGGFPRSVAVGDFNGDGKPDLAVANRNSNNVSVLLGNGSGGFSAQTTFAAGSNPYSVAVGDFNGDGKTDLTVANILSNNVSVLLGNGSGGFGSQITFAAGDGSRFVAVEDFNGDGKTDLAVANGNSNNVSVLLGNGSGGFGTQTTFATGSFTYSVAVGDFNGDGKTDLAVANALSNNVSMLLGNGSGGFGAQTTFVVENRPASVAVGDFNGDAKTDLAVANAYSNNVSVMLNTTLFPLSLSISPNSFSEGAGANAATGTVTRIANPLPVTVTLTSSDTTEATGPLITVTIPANQASVTFPVAAVDDLIADGVQPVIFTATASGYADAIAAVSVLDNEPTTITGTFNADTLAGTDANELIDGLGGRDVLTGSGGNDTLIGGSGSDILTGGTGLDVFVYNSILDGTDTITDFASTIDKINLSILLDNVVPGGYSGSNAITDGYVVLRATGSDVMVQIDSDAGGALFTPRSLVLVRNISAATLSNPVNFTF